MKQKILILLSGIIIGVTATLILQMWVLPTSSPQRQTTDSLDAHFIEQMIPHHEDAVTMSQIALTKAERQEVKTLAMQIIDDQNHEIEQMRMWYKEWFGRELPTGDEVMKHHGMGSMSTNTLHMGITGTGSDITTLENSDDFDKAFVEHMIPHHQMAVMMASMLKDGTQRPEMRTLADTIITAQTKEIELMRMWIRNWE